MLRSPGARLIAAGGICLTGDPGGSVRCRIRVAGARIGGLAFTAKVDDMSAKGFRSWSRLRGVLQRLVFALAMAALAAGVEAAEVPRLRLQLDWEPGAQFAGIYVAEMRGAFSRLAVEVTVVAHLADGGLGRRVATEPDLVGVFEGYVFLQERAKHPSLRAVGVMYPRSPAGLISLASRPVVSASDLTGAVIGLHAYGGPMLRAVLVRQGVSPDAVEVRRVEGGLAPLLERRVHAVQGYAVEELRRLRAHRGEEARFVPFADLGVASPAGLLVVSEELARSQPEAVGAMLEALRWGWQTVLTDRDGAVADVRRAAEAGKPREDWEAAVGAVEPWVDATVPVPDGAALVDLRNALVAAGLELPVWAEDALVLKSGVPVR